MITDAQEANIAAKRARIAQDKKHPHVIHIDDGRLMPNVAKLRVHPKYRVYHGPIDASPEDRLRWLDANMRAPRPKIVNSQESSDTFDIGKATKDELIVFAASEMGLMLDDKDDIVTIRKKIMAAANAQPAEDSLA